MLGIGLELTTTARGGASAFSPASLFAASEAGGWYDTSDLSTMFVDTAGATPATVGQPVGLLRDKSGRGNHFTQATTAAKPILRQDANGNYYLDFDGVDDGMSVASFALAGNARFGLVMAVRQMTAVQTILLEHSTAAFSNVDSFSIVAELAGRPRIFAIDTVSTLDDRFTNATPLASNTVLTMETDIAQALAANKFRWRVNGADDAGYSVDDTALARTSWQTFPLFLGCRNNAAGFSAMRFYGLVLRGGGFTTQQRTQAEGFVGSKAGVAL